MSLINNQQATIDTTVPAISIGQIMLSADRRSSSENKLTDAQRIRRAVLPAGHWGNLSGMVDGAASQSLTDVLRNAIRDIGNLRLRDVLAENADAKVIELKDFTVAALLAWNDESAATRGSFTFTREQVEEWFEVSATKKALSSKHAANPKLPALLELAKNRFATLAAKNHGLKDENDCDKLLSLIDAADVELPLVIEIVGRLEHVKKLILARKNVALSMDDL